MPYLTHLDIVREGPMWKDRSPGSHRKYVRRAFAFSSKWPGEMRILCAGQEGWIMTLAKETVNGPPHTVSNLSLRTPHRDGENMAPQAVLAKRRSDEGISVTSWRRLSSATMW